MNIGRAALRLQSLMTGVESGTVTKDAALTELASMLAEALDALKTEHSGRAFWGGKAPEYALSEGTIRAGDDDE